MSNGNNRGFNPQQPSFTTTTGGKHPKQIHIAHRRSPSELTNLMMEQIALQRQLEIVQAQQQQILSQQGGGNNAGGHQYQLSGNFGGGTSGTSGLQPPVSYHRRTSSNTHKRSQSSVTGAMGSFSLQNNLAPPPKLGGNNSDASLGSSPSLGHNRRHSLGLNEAKRAAAQVQAQRAGKEVPPQAATPPQITTTSAEGDNDSSSMPPPSGFKFPSTSVDPPSQPAQPLRYQQGHGRSRSMAPQSPQRSFQFPPKSPHQEPSQSYHERRQSGHYRSNSRNNNLDAMNQNWRQRQPSPQRQGQYENNLDLLAPPNAPQFNSSPGFTPSHRPRGSHGGNSISSMSAFQLAGQQQNTGGRKSLFAPYLPQSSIPELVADGRLVVGTLRVNKKNRSDAYVSTDGLLDADIFICGSKDRNRALEGDLVAVELLSVDEVWSSKREKEQKKRRKDHNAPDVIIDDVHNDASTRSTLTSSPGSSNSAGTATTVSSSGTDATSTFDSSSEAITKSGSLQRKGSLKQRPTLKKNDDVEVEGQSLLLVEEEEINDEYKPLYAGHVVAVIDRIPGQLFAGTLGLLRPSQQAKENQNQGSGYHHPPRPKIVWFKPTDKKVPLIAIPTEQAPKDFVENVDKYLDKLFVASIKRWPITSLHPFGTLISELGPMNDSRTEVDAILRDNNFLCEEYLNDQGVEREDYELSSVDMESELASRKNFSSEYVLAISETGFTSDHAVHVKRISNEKIELGVHISDVTAYIKEGSLLDKNARKRSSSVFLAQKTVHLLPRVVNELLSFNKNEKKLSMSVVFEIDTTKFEVDNVWIGESYIQPKIRLTYDQIDSILNSEEDQEISSASKDYIKTISLISREFRRQRLENPKLGNEVNLTLLDQVDDEKTRLHLNLFKSSLSSFILNEILIKVNSTVAQRNYAILGDSAFLRKHPIPTLQKLETFKRKVTDLNIQVDTSSPSSLINSILSIEDPIKRQSVEILLYKALTRSKYFVAGKVDPESYGAFYFNIPLYTHFTSPLRRYADFIAHRQLKLTLKKNDTEGENLEIPEPTTEELESLKMTAEYCNFKKDCAKASQDQSVHLLLSQTINEMSKRTGQLLVVGTVLQVYESAFDVYIPEFGIEKRVHGDQLPLKKAEFDKKNGLLELYWEKGIDTATYIPDDEREPLSYRNSIKNKFKTASNDIARVLKSSKEDMIPSKVHEAFEKLNLTPPSIAISSQSPTEGQFAASQSVPSTPVDAISRPGNDRTSSTSKIDDKVLQKKSDLDEYLKGLKLRVEGGDYIQEIRELEQVPVLLRAEIGMALPCLTVHALNPFTNFE